MPLKNLVNGFKNLISYPRIIDAIKNNPYIFGGENRTDTEIIQKTDDLIAKVGAGGLCVVLNYNKGKAFAVKVDDCSYEARKIVVYEAINRLGWGSIDYDNSIKTISGKVVGKISVEIGL
jgi:L-asparaginase II